MELKYHFGKKVHIPNQTTFVFLCVNAVAMMCGFHKFLNRLGW